MKRRVRMTKAFRYLLASLVIVAGLITLVGSDTGGWPGGVAPVYAAFTAQPTRGPAPLEVFFDASASSGEIVAYYWEFGDGGVGGGITPRHTYTTPGTYTVSLTVESARDPWGGAHHDYAYLEITVEGSINAAYTAQPTSGPPPLEVNFDASASSDQDGTIISYEWGFGDGQRGEGITTTHTYTSAGVYIPSLTVTNDVGANHTLHWQCKPNIEVGIPTAAFTAQPTTGLPPLEITFNASGSFYDYGSIVSYQWYFGDGSSTQGVTTTHTYTTTGSYLVNLSVRNDVDGWNDTTQVIKVGTGMPTAAFTAQPSSGTAPLEVIFDASASSDPDGTIINYYWDFCDWQWDAGVTTSYVYTTPGTYTVTLEVFDNQGYRDLATQVITVEAN